MDGRKLNLEQNWTISSCSEPYGTIYFAMTNVLLFTCLPTTTLVFMKLLNRLQKTRRFLPAEVFLLQLNFTNGCLFVSHLLLFLDAVHVGHFSMTVLLLFYIPSLTARPIFLLAITVILYLAIVHPVTYMTAKTLLHWEWWVTTLVWLYTLAMDVAIIIYKTDTSQLVFTLFHITILPIFFFNVIMLRALYSIGPGNSRQTLSSAKKKAFQLILSTLVVLLVYYFPQAYLFTYRSVAPTDWQKSQCCEGVVILMLLKFFDFAIAVISFCSLAELGFWSRLQSNTFLLNLQKNKLKSYCFLF